MLNRNNSDSVRIICSLSPFKFRPLGDSRCRPAIVTKNSKNMKMTILKTSEWATVASELFCHEAEHFSQTDHAK